MDNNQEIQFIKNEEQSKANSKKLRFFFRRIAKDIKRVRWPDSSTNSKNLVKILIFTVIFVLFVFVVSFAFQSLWNHWNI
ncbi:preprotein translocase subunit SecE [Mycoplasmopsis gallopavonis]|nr:preprotein translocase subunit SecE [Mycoplasmopsis gallopavonis]RIV16957.1 preprotein translocase subunit SecE [Mycoplasmopsis gallopavonis]